MEVVRSPVSTRPITPSRAADYIVVMRIRYAHTLRPWVPGSFLISPRSNVNHG